ncbi:hypothetical protein CRYUN_Cryun15aG0123300 [Craigia yunnanensis]
MAIDIIEASSPPSQPPSNFSSSNQLRHFYVAVDRLHFKMETLIDLLGVAGRRTYLPIVVCCSSRDELDAVYSAVSNLSFISLSSLYSDQADAERALVLEKFREATMNWNQQITVQTGDGHEIEKEEQKSRMIVVTDVCLPLLASGESPISGRVLINYELPTKKETYMRRLTSCLAADGIVINMVVGGEVVTLKSLEESSGLIIAEMPINFIQSLSLDISLFSSKHTQIGKASTVHLGVQHAQLHDGEKAVFESTRQRSAETEVAKAFSAIETDGDGFINYREFTEMMHNMEEGINANDIQSAFRVYDLDGNGKISAEELVQVLEMLEMGERCSLEACCKMIRGVDADGMV